MRESICALAFSYVLKQHNVYCFNFLFIFIGRLFLIYFFVRLSILRSSIQILPIFWLVYLLAVLDRFGYYFVLFKCFIFILSSLRMPYFSVYHFPILFLVPCDYLCIRILPDIAMSWLISCGWFLVSIRINQAIMYIPPVW